MWNFEEKIGFAAGLRGFPTHGLPSGRPQAERQLIGAVPRFRALGEIAGSGAGNAGTGADRPPDTGVMSPNAIDFEACGITPVAGRFGLYVSSDHSGSGSDGIWLWTADDIEGPWTYYGHVYDDTVTDGIETETPTVVWNDDTGLLHLYYSMNFTTGATADQALLLATSPDGITWTRYGKVLDWPEANFMRGRGNLGYGRVTRIGPLWILRHSSSGGGMPQAVSYSRDGKNWITDPRPLVGGPYHRHGVDDFSLNANVAFFMWDGRLWGIGDAIELGGSIGAGALNSGYIWMAPFSADGRQMIGAAYKAIDVGGTGTWNELRVNQPFPVQIDGRLYIFGRGQDAAGTENQIGLWVEDAENGVEPTMLIPPSTGLAIIEGMDGKEIPAGRVMHEWEWSAAKETALPSWLDAVSGTATFSGPASGQPYLQMTTGAVIGNQAEIRTNINPSLLDFDEIRWTLEGLRLSTDSNLAALGGISQQNVAGTRITQTEVEDEVIRAVDNIAAGNVETEYSRVLYALRGARDQGVGKKNLILRIFPRRGWFVVMEDDQYLLEHPIAAGALNANYVNGFFRIQTKEAVAKHFRVAKIKFALIHN